MSSTFPIKAKCHYDITPLGTPAFSCCHVSCTAACLPGQQGEHLSVIAPHRQQHSLYGRKLSRANTHTCTTLRFSPASFGFICWMWYRTTSDKSVYFLLQLFKTGYWVMEEHGTASEGLQNFLTLVFLLPQVVKSQHKERWSVSPMLVCQPRQTTYTWSKNYCVQEQGITKDITDNTGNKLMQARL